MAKHSFPISESLGVSADILEAERARVRDIQTQSAARVMERVRESQRFTVLRVDGAPIRARRQVMRYAAAAVTGLAAGLLMLVSLKFWAPVSPLERSAPQMQQDFVRTAPRMASAQDTHVLESAIDQAHPGSILLVPVGTRLDAADATIRITKPLRIDTPS